MKNSTGVWILLGLIVLALAAGGRGQASASTSTAGSVEQQIQSVFGVYGWQAVNIAKCESSLNPAAYNTTPVWNGEHAMGLFQIIPSTFHRVSSGDPYNVTDNINAAYAIFKQDGYSWREWQCQP